MASPQPMTERQEAILLYLMGQGDGASRTAAEIAIGIGIDTGPRRTRGPWSGRQSPAQYVIGSLTGLAKRRYIGLGDRRDGLTGTAYRLTPSGREAAGEAAERAA